LRAQCARGFDQGSRLAVELNETGRLLRSLQRLFRIGQLVLGLQQLLLKKGPPL
jgi:hypothetical protein